MSKRPTTTSQDSKTVTDWWMIKISSEAKFKESISYFLFETGAQAVEENAGFVLTYIEESEKNSFTDKIESKLKEASIPYVLESVLLKDRSWADEYKKYYKAQRLSRTFFLRPLWDEDTVIPDEMLGIVMDPGLAFGTGLHASTRLSISLLERALNQISDPEQVSLLDLGTGSGILAIAASKLGVNHIDAFDNDLDSVTTAQENFEINGCGRLKAELCEIHQTPRKFDIILANILLETHLILKDEYVKHLKPNGRLILSGVLGQQFPNLKEQFSNLPLIEEIRIYLKEWVAVSYLLSKTVET